MLIKKFIKIPGFFTLSKLVLFASVMVFAAGCFQGDKGADGNANIICYNFGPQTTTTGNLTYTITDIDQETIDSSLILVYYTPSIETASSWYPCPGISTTAAYETRYFLTEVDENYIAMVGVKLHNVGSTALYTSSVTFSRLKVIIAPASSIINPSVKKQPDFSDYNQVREYFGLQD